MKKPILTGIMLAGFSLLSTVSFSQQTLNVAGHSAKINGMSFDYSIGEMTLISTERNPNLIVTQGLLQPSGPGSAASDASSGNTLNQLADRIQVYPNPTQHELFVETYETVIADYGLNLFDGAGKIVLSREGKTVVGVNRFTLDLQSLAGGTYYLMVRKNGENGQPQNYSFKIQKMN